MAKLALVIGVVLWACLVTFVFWPSRVGADLYLEIGFLLGGTIAIIRLTVDLIETSNARHIEIRGNKTIKYFHPLDNTLAVFRSGRWDADTPAPLPSLPSDATSEAPDPPPIVRTPYGLRNDPFSDTPACPDCGSLGQLDEIRSTGQYGNGAYRLTFTCPKCRAQFCDSTPYNIEVYRDNRWSMIVVPGIEERTQAEVEQIARKQVAAQSDIPPEDVIVRVTAR